MPTLPRRSRRHILHQIKANHEAQKPEGLAKNFVLIREVNLNIEQVRACGGSPAGGGTHLLSQSRARPPLN
jgi:hypothetical protein